MTTTLSQPTKALKPFLKWVGGKRQLLPVIRKYIPRHTHTYYEPFVGAGAVLLDLKPRKAIVNDLNSELINCYQVIKNQADDLIACLQSHQNDKDYFYEVRAWDRESSYQHLTRIEKAARTIYLNKTCFNGLYRVNQKGQFNSPFGNYRNPNIVNAEGLKVMSHFLKRHHIQFMNTDFENVLSSARWGDFVYFDPPYDPVSETASFTAYQNGGFHRPDQERLKRMVDELTRRGCRVMLSNSCTDFIRSLYKNYQIIQVAATRRINSVAERRGKINEVLVLNYNHETGEVFKRTSANERRLIVA